MERRETIRDWLAKSDWKDWERSPMSGDASARRYERLTFGGKSMVFMDAPPETCGSQANFVKIAMHLRNIGLCAPEIHDWNEQTGLMILEDLGGSDFSQYIARDPVQETQLYHAALDVLKELQSNPPPADLSNLTPEVGTDMIGIAFDCAAVDPSTDLKETIESLIKRLMKSIDEEPKVLSLRDFHAENLIWRPGNTGNRRIGLLDFQDAFISHPMYDVASLVRDARRDVGADIIDVLVPNPRDRTAFHVIALQRNLRILGIFHRLAKRDGKTKYLSYIPRVWGHIQADLKTPETQALAPLINRAFGGS